jgi:hypothetical protein
MRFQFVISVLLLVPGAFWLGRLSAPEPEVPIPVECPTCTPVDCSAAALASAAAVAQECSETLDCRNVWRHPDKCSADCRYHALEAGLGKMN